MSTKSELKELKKLIFFYRGLVNDFPNNNPYKDALARLENKRADTVLNIGKKKKNEKST